jgi:hypothetical protein
MHRLTSSWTEDGEDLGRASGDEDEDELLLPTVVAPPQTSPRVPRILFIVMI